MKRQILIGLSILLAGASFASADKLPYKRGELIVRFADTGAGSPVRKAVAGPLSNRAVKGVISNLAVPGARVANEYEGITPGLAVVSLPEGATVADALGQFNGSPGVLYAQPNYIYKLAAIPNDPYFSLLWNMEQIDAPEAWNIQTNGIGAIVAVMDTGIDYAQSSSEVDGHEDLFDNLWINQWEDMPERGVPDANDINDVDDDDNGLVDDIIGADFGGDLVEENDPDSSPENVPDDAHGTHVTGIIGAVGNNGIGVAGVCWQAQIMTLKIFADDYTEETGALTIDIVRAIDYAIENKAEIINASWGAYEIELDQLLYDRIRNARDEGILFVAAAGNGDEFGFPVDTDFMPFYPASYNLDNIISVMATNASDYRAWYSNYGFETVDLAAPGGDETTSVYSTVLDDEYDDEYDDEGMFGTSVAAPHVSGAAALMWSANSSLTYGKVKKLLLYSTDKLPSLQGLCVSGGRLNLHRALKMAEGGEVLNVDTGRRYDTIQDAIRSASDGDELIADRDSWYIEDVDFGSKQITLRSGNINNPGNPTVYPHNTFISGHFDPGSGVVTFTGAGPGAVLKGFTILDGSHSGIYCNSASPIIEDCVITKNTNIQGGGIYCTNDSAPTIIDCDIVNNTAWDSGGGIYCSDSDPDIIDCTIRNNNADPNDGGGIYCGSGSDADITGCYITGNTAGKSGGGIYVSSSSPTINGCEVAGNTTNSSGGGIYCKNSSGADIINTTVRNNTTKYWGGGIYCYNSSGLIKNCLIINNSVESWDGGGIYLEKSSPAIANCTIAGNAANENNGIGGGLCCFDSSDPDITDCIFADNERYAVANYYYDPLQVSEPHLRYCLFYNNSEGDYVIYDDISSPPVLTVYTGAAELDDIAGNSDNIEDAPLFVRGRLGDYYLSQGPAGQIFLDPNTGVVLDANSPAVDAGSGTAAAVGMSIYSTRTDTVVDGGIVDIGYHYDDPVPMQYYDLTAVVTPSDSGTLIPSGTTSHKQYANVLLKATPDNEYRFKCWYGTDDDTVVQLDSEDWPRRVQYNVVTMDSNEIVTVRFETVLVQLITSASGESGTISPSTHRPRYYKRGEVVNLYADPCDPSHAIIWTGTDDDYSILRYNTVTMVEPFTEGPDGGDAKEVNVEFYDVQTLYYPGDGSYATLQVAIDAAHNRDIIIVAESNEPYINSWGYDVDGSYGKAITITSARPDDPCCVAKTVFTLEAGEEGNVGNAFRFWSVGRNTILNGITLRGWSHYGGDGEDGDGDPYYDGEPGGDDFGGAISCWYASPTIKNCVIVDCNISGGAGGDGTGGDSEHPNGGNGGWPGRAYGGGLACFYGSNPLVVNSTFDNCSAAGGVGGDGGNATSDGGAGGRGGGYYYGYTIPSPWEWENAYYEDDFNDPTKYGGRGGAVYVGPGCSPTFIGCTFNSNYSQGGSIGICGQNEPSGSRDQPSIHWRISNMGGAVYCGADSEAKFVDCVFTDNYADVNIILPEDPDYNNNTFFVGFGGAVGFDEGAKVSFESCTFSDNYASVGGAMYWNNSDPLIANCTVTNNWAMHGGGMLFVGGTAKIARSNFNVNEATELGGQGGAVCSLGANIEITDCDIVNNDAATSGGGIYIAGTGDDSLEGLITDGASDGTLLVRNCLITQNSAFRDGGGISANWHSDPNIVNCTIKDNIVTDGRGGGLFCSYGNYTNVLNSILWGNYAGTGAQIAVATSDEYDPRPSTVKVSYSDVQDGEADVFVDASPGANCELIWDHSTNLTGGSLSDPNFVSGYLGSYLGKRGRYRHTAFLSQPDTGELNQTVLSPCVDKGSSGDAYGFGMYRHTTRTDGVLDTGRVDMGYHYLRAADIIGDYNFDGVVDFINDYVMFLRLWLEKDCDFPDWCFGADLNKDGIVNFKDDALFKVNYGEEETTPPVPDPMTWAIAPVSAGEISIAMRATEAFDNSGYPVSYYFQRTDANGVPDPDFQGQWRCSETYTDTELATGFEYGYRVRATDYKHRDPCDPNYPLDPNDPGAPFDVDDPNDPNIGNKTGWSVIGYAITGEGVPDDTDPPTPNPMTWVDPAYTATMSSITLFATTASDVSGVEYYFEDYDNPEYKSGWINDSTWTDTSLAPLTTYRYRVMARDKSINQNTTGWSSVLSATTLEEGEEPPPAPSSLVATAVSSSQIDLSWVDNADNEDGFRLERSTEGGSFSQIAMVGADVTSYSDTGLAELTMYTYRVCAYSSAGNSAFSNEASATTLELPLPPLAPSSLVATVVSSSQIDLSWADNADNEDGFMLERSTEGGLFSQIATVGADATGYSDTGLAELTMYTYRVCAYNSAGNSAFSNEDSATTLGLPLPDSQPPLPNPSEWLVPPYMYETGGTRYHSMTAVEAFDVDTGGNDPVWYYFDMVNGNGTDSGWQLSTTYTYPHNSNCVYVVRTRDNVGNVGQDSAPAYTGD